jgi:hypothetical protein
MNMMNILGHVDLTSDLPSFKYMGEYRIKSAKLFIL